MDEIVFRKASAHDIADIVALLADDDLGKSRETPQDLEPYEQAFQAIVNDENQRLIVACQGSHVVGTMQLTFIPGLSRQGALRAQIEGVRVHDRCRGTGLGRSMMMWAVDEAERGGAKLVQLTSDAARPDAHRFYENLGFEPPHVGFKKPLTP